MLDVSQERDAKRYVELVTDKPVERFIIRLFLRGADIRSLSLVSPYISSLSNCRFTLGDLRKKVEREKTPTFLVTRSPTEEYQQEAMRVLLGSPWIEIRYNDAVHAKVYVAWSSRESESFGLFGSANLTTQSILSNIEVAMMLYGRGAGRHLLRELHYWANVRLRTLQGSVVVQRITARRE